MSDNTQCGNATTKRPRPTVAAASLAVENPGGPSTNTILAPGGGMSWMVIVELLRDLGILWAASKRTEKNTNA